MLPEGRRLAVKRDAVHVLVGMYAVQATNFFRCSGVRARIKADVAAGSVRVDTQGWDRGTHAEGRRGMRAQGCGKVLVSVWWRDTSQGAQLEGIG